MPKNEDRLGTGLAALFGDHYTDLINDIQNNTVDESIGTPAELKIREIRSNPYQPRKVFDEEKLNELAQSIKEHGVFNPILVRRARVGYELVAGERRLKAAQIAGKEEIPAIVVEFSDDQMMEISLLENIQRENLTAIEEAAAYKQLMEKMHYTQEELANRVGKSREHIANTLRLLKLPANVQQMVSEGKLSMGQVRPLITMESSEAVRKLANRIYNEGLSVREVEKLVRNIKEPSDKKPPVAPIDSATLNVQNTLQKKLQTKVRISSNAITISYGDVADLNRILELIGYDEDDQL